MYLTQINPCLRQLHELRSLLQCDKIVCRAQSTMTNGSRTTPDTALKILVIDEDPIRSAILETGLREAGFSNVLMFANATGLLEQVYRVDPEVILIDLENPSRDVLEQMFQVSRIVRRPIAMFVDQSDRSTTAAAIDAGVSAYIVDGLKKERVKHILDLCISRFNAFSRLQDELDRTKSALQERKVIDRAKGILMQAKRLSEEQAYALLRSTAMNEKRKIADVAQSVITAAELLR
jgi:two-component system, response regulator / RNA-binding antiterminator